MLHLPEDIRLCIVEQLSTENLTAPEQHDARRIATQTLSSLCLTSRRICAVALPILYRTLVRMSKVYKTDPVHGSVYDDIGGKATETLELFIRNLLDQSSLASHVWFVRVQEREDEGQEDDTDSELQFSCCPDDYELERFETPSQTMETPCQTTETRIKTARIPDEALLNSFVDSTRRIPALDPESADYGWHDTWRSDLARGMDNAAIALLLTLVPNLKHLDIESWYSKYSWHFNMLVKQSFSIASWAKDEGGSTADTTSFRLISSPLPQESLPLFPQLEVLTLRREEYCSGWGLEAYLPLLDIPTLKSFNLIGMSDFFTNDSAKYRMPTLCNLRYLRLQNVDCHPSGPLTLIMSCSRLQSFEYLPPMYSSEVRFDQSLPDALAEKANTLKRLQLILPIEDQYVKDNVRLANRFDLQRLWRLESLEISQNILFPKSSREYLRFWDLLPVSLESLVIREVDDGLTITLSNFVEQQGYEDFPRLRYLELVETEEFANSCLDDSRSSGALQKSWPEAVKAQFSAGVNRTMS